jgi:hypothetical protein
LTMVASRMIMSMPTHSTTSASQGFRIPANIHAYAHNYKAYNYTA